MGTIVKLIFNDGSGDYQFPYVQQVSDPKEGIKATVIHGKRADGCLIIPGGKRSQEIRVKGILHASDYVSLTDLMNIMRTNVTTKVATLTLKHNSTVDWSYQVRRIDEIRFPQSLRTSRQEYECTFIVLSY